MTFTGMPSRRLELTLVVLLAATVALSGCGRRGALEPPPQAGVVYEPGVVTDPGAPPPEPAPPPPPQRRFFLDFLL